MEDGCCSVCSKSGAKKCSRCKVQYYCGKECQKKDWKIHKKVCSDVAETTFVRQFRETLTPQANPTEPSNPMNEMFVDMDSMNLGALGLGQCPEIPKFHDEYKAVYPRDVTFYKELKESWKYSKMLPKEIVIKGLNWKKLDKPTFFKRWGPSALSDELGEFLSKDTKPGDIFMNKPNDLYGYFGGKQLYQSIRNSPVPPKTFELGETYVAVGFVDLFPLVVGSFVQKGTETAEHRPLVYYGYDMSVIVITRNMILYQMMKDNRCIDSILQVWFSSGWSKKTLDEFHLACGQVLKNLDSTIHCNLAIKELLTHWMDTTVSMKSVQALWIQHFDPGLLHPLPNLCHEKDRVEYARYISTGHIFGSTKSDFMYGNISMFSLPDSFDGFKREAENVFAAIALDSFEYGGFLLASVTRKIKEGVQNLIEHMENNSIVCHFITAEFNPQKYEELTGIKKLNAKEIDWSNIPDYLKHDDFFTMAKACDGTNTLHSLHFMNWMFYVYGTCLIDYGNMSEVYKDLINQREKNFRHAKHSRPFFRQDAYIEYYMNSSQRELGRKYRKNFIDFFFGGQNVDISEPISEDFNPFARSQDTFFLSFSFRK